MHTDPHKVQADPETSRVPRAVWGGTALLTVGRLFASGSTALILILLARVLPADEFGRLTFYLAAILLLEAVTDFGTSAVILRDGSGSAAALARGIATGRKQRFLFASIAGLSVTLIAAAYGETWESGLPWIALAMLYPLTRTEELYSLAYQREIAWSVPVTVRAAASLVRLIAVVIVVALGARTAPPFLFAHTLGLALGNLVLGRLARKRLPRPTGELLSRRALLLATLPIGIAVLSQQLYFNLDNGFLLALRSKTELGHYNAAVRVVSLLVTASTFATVAALPWLARRHRHGDLAAATARLATPLTLGSGLALGCLWPWTDELLGLLFSAPFRAAGDALRTLLFGAFIMHANAGLLTAVFASKRSRSVLAITGGAVIMNVLLNTWWVPAHGMEGAALATVLTELFVGVASWLVLVRAREAPARTPAIFLLGCLAFVLTASLSTLFT